ncbi:YpdA family putative bacillithiol disulfide reductase [Paracidobacterium acidisoli]|uniref:YpdA family putative bacillithiol disulfide reductase n=1 Tax=Paracidobacterium acidisoli TaxID=2303751 RepID=A0A372IQ61_9BACT|nr:YpdA family putative bacillithiol disulfide reductase [Paracidobacterium acidisoli]MBT9331450.1 YpdA family putative bacillithiol disulfide reductase [Paracidobacterium acidisoli]
MDAERNGGAASETFDVLVVGAGPTGMACAIEAQRAGFRVALVDKGCLCNSLFHYPSHMTFFTTPELLEIGDIPFPSPNQKPNRNEALEYYRKVAEHYALDIRQYQNVERVSGSDGGFHVFTRDRFEREHTWRTRKLIVATGYYDLPNYLDIPGEDLPKVLHYYNDPHPYFDLDVVIIGGKNSAAIAALELWRHGARVTIVHRGASMHRHVKYWILPDIENRIKNGEITAHFESRVTRIDPDAVTISTPRGEQRIPNDAVFAMTGYHPDFDFLESLGVRIEGQDHCPACDRQTLESNVPGIYLAGVIIAGFRTHEIFIENGRFHGRQIADDLKQKLPAPAMLESSAD